MILAYLQRHDPRRYKPALATLAGPGDLVNAAKEIGVDAYHLAGGSPVSLPFEMRRLIVKLQPQIVHSYLFHTNILARLLRPFTPMPKLICGMRSVYFPGAYPWWYHRADAVTHRLCDRFIANSSAGRDSLVKMAGILANKIDVVPNGIDVEKYKLDRAECRSRIVKEFSLPDNAFLLGIIAQLRPRKHHSLLFQAFHPIAHNEPRARLLVVGDGIERDNLIALREKLGLVSQVVFAGYRSDVPRILAALDAFVLPTSLEGSPVSVMEAMVAGLPVIAANAGGVAELVQHNRTGILVEPGDCEALTEAMSKVMEDAGFRTELGENAKEKIRNEYTLENMARNTEAVYDKLIGS